MQPSPIPWLPIPQSASDESQQKRRPGPYLIQTMQVAIHRLRGKDRHEHKLNDPNIEINQEARTF